jgi:hypothetical protein
MGNEQCMESFSGNITNATDTTPGPFVAQVMAMESTARRMDVASVKLRYVTGSYLGILSENKKCPNGPKHTRALVAQLKAADR